MEKGWYETKKETLIGLWNLGGWKWIIWSQCTKLWKVMWKTLGSNLAYTGGSGKKINEV